MEGNKRTIQELIYRYELEPTIYDVFVEGSRDRAVLEWFFSTIYKKIDVAVYDVSTIEVDIEIAQQYDIDIKRNNRNKLIVLAYALDSLISDSSRVRIIIDSDFDILLNKNYECHCLQSTDYANLEMYLFNPRVITKYLNLALKGFPKSSEFVISQLRETLQTVFIIRLTNEILSMKMKWLDFTRLCNIKKFSVKFNENEFIERYMNRNNKIPEKEIFENTISTTKKLLTEDSRNQIHGHDFLLLFQKYIIKNSKSKKKMCPNTEVLESNLFSCLEINDLKNESLFIMLENWLNTEISISESD